MQENLLKEYGLYINGEWRPASDGATFSSTDPATGEHLAVCAEATKVDVDNAVKAAQKAFETWKDTTAQQRAEILNKIADIIDANAVHLAKVESMDNGKPFRETSGIDIPMSADHFRYFAAAIRTQEGTATMLDNNTMSWCCTSLWELWDKLFPGISPFDGRVEISSGVGCRRYYCH